MFERFTDCARRSVVLAQEAASAMGHAEVTTGHLLAGLAAEDGGVASIALANLCLMPDDARVAMRDQRAGTWPRPAHIPFTPGLKKAMENALREAIVMTHAYIGTEHLLLGLLCDPEDGPAAQILTGAGITPTDIRAEVMRLLGSYEQPRAAPAEPEGHHRRLATVPASALPPLADLLDTVAGYYQEADPPTTPECEPHEPLPRGYIARSSWAEVMAMTHTQRRCKGCGLWKIWTPKEAKQ